MPTQRVNGIPMHFQQHGDGPDVVLIHAFTSNLSSWTFSGIVSELSKEFRVTCYDLRGHGLSGVTRTGYTSAGMAHDLKCLHEVMKLGPIHVVGHSFGGVIGFHAAVEYPEVVSSVVLSDSYFPALRRLEPDLGSSEAWADLRVQMLTVGVDIGDCVDFHRLFGEVARWQPDQFVAAKQTLGPPQVRWLEHICRLAGTQAADEIFATAGLTESKICSLQQPVLALYDEFSPFEATCDYLRDHLPRVQVGVVPEAKHFAPWQNPDEFLRLVLEHLRRLA